MDLTGRWNFGPDQSADARQEGDWLIIQVSGGPTIRLQADLSGFYRIGPRSGERAIRFEQIGEELVGHPAGMRARVTWRFSRS